MGQMFKFILEHFSHVFPIVLCGALGLIIMAERALALTVTYPMDAFENFFERVRVLIMKDRIPDAIALCEQMHSKPVARVVRAGLNRAHQPQELIEHGLQIAVGEATEIIQARTGFLGTIANVSTLFGLLGTIIGLVQSFEAVGAASAQQRSAMLANGISTAMNATMLGLGVAIPCMIAFSFLNSRASKIASQVDQSAIRTLDLLQQRYFRATDNGPTDEATFQEVISPRRGA
jgi:biopolymer transport protein ExbB/TolQ